MVALLEHHELGGPGGSVRKALALAGGNELVAGTKHDKQRTFDLLRRARKRDPTRDLVRLRQVLAWLRTRNVSWEAVGMVGSTGPKSKGPQFDTHARMRGSNAAASGA